MERGRLLGDSIAEPDYSFYGKHRSQIKSINRMFEANGSGGTADIYEEPEAEEPVIKMENGSVFCVIHMYTDKKGDKWGSLLYDVQGNDTAKTQFYAGDHLGWVKMEDLLVRYDEMSFREEYGNNSRNMKASSTDIRRLTRRYTSGSIRAQNISRSGGCRRRQGTGTFRRLTEMMQAACGDIRIICRGLRDGSVLRIL
ncbi:hypothetical protein [Lactonifactor longoviformis]|uniref:hypothetical protein n=1 Tax=Lactonifactor longoviformis TaxID=341220 RepID=UPI001D015982|nr:hypothetical protein [Lactonifactor longoviformis]MCB5713675.1 hypothetical protein [Lactonifactor longoviformis]MCB5717774.1 hypothetical protein [Lactonifactor longoviformis]